MAFRIFINHPWYLLRKTLLIYQPSASLILSNTEKMYKTKYDINVWYFFYITYFFIVCNMFSNTYDIQHPSETALKHNHDTEANLLLRVLFTAQYTPHKPNKI